MRRNNVNTDYYLQAVNVLLDSIFVLRQDMHEEPSFVIPSIVRGHLQVAHQALTKADEHLSNGFHVPEYACFFCGGNDTFMTYQSIACRRSGGVIQGKLCDHCYWTVYSPAEKRMRDAT